MPDQPHDDPIVGRSLSGPLLVASLILLATLAWALYDEFYGLRPWKDYQQHFVHLYTQHLQERIQEQSAVEEELRRSPDYQRLEQALEEARAGVAPEVERIDREVNDLNRRISALTDVFATARGQVTAMIYEAETAPTEEDKEQILEEVERIRQRGFDARLPVPDGTMETLHYTYHELEDEYDQLRERRAFLLAHRVEVTQHVKELEEQRQTYRNQHIVGLAETQLRGLLTEARNLEFAIKQIHVQDTELVDRCESCHLGVLEGGRVGIELTAADMGGERLFASHPAPELLAIHDPERFGCSPCHGGNGRAISSPIQAHGRYKHWLWPLYYPENYQAGCQQCHARDMVLEHAGVLNRGKELYRLRGCIGCHRFEGFDDEPERLQAVRLQMRELELQRAGYELERQRSIQRAEDPDTPLEEARRLFSRETNLRVTISNLEAEQEQLQLRARDLMREIKLVGPNLKDVRLKLLRDWIPVWLHNPHAFRPTTKMPRFRLQEEEIRAISAFIWQSGTSGEMPPQPRGDPGRGRELFETRGCLACHALGEGEDAVGGAFAANLSRVGEKVNYDYLVRWIHNPRQRTRPYCPREKRDLTPADYARHGLPFRFDFEHSTCPNDGAELQVQNMTVMPSLRLTWAEARDIATFLLAQRSQAPETYAGADFMDDSQLFEQGRSLVRNYGCAGCHEIAGLEEEGRIGTDLTAEGSKPIERIDFALLTHQAEREGWYNHAGFFERKLADPAIFDQGKVKEPLERLRMPQPNLTDADITALTTLLLGSVEPGYGFPPQYIYQPTDRRRDIQEGWWIITKYNCMGCHQIRIGQPSLLMTLPRYQTPEGREKLPPSLIGVGARLDPEWLAAFLANPALSTTNLHRNGVRPYLEVRMPTFGFTVREIQTLVRFFGALSGQAQPYIRPQLEPLTNREWVMARELFTHPAAPCLRCHATGDPLHDRNATAPNFLLVKERLKPGWTRRWILDPASIIPGTAMPSGLFRPQGNRQVFSGPLPPSLRDYRGDHAELLVRYMFSLTPQEQRRLSGRLASAGSVESRRISLNLVESH